MLTNLTVRSKSSQSGCASENGHQIKLLQASCTGSNSSWVHSQYSHTSGTDTPVIQVCMSLCKRRDCRIKLVFVCTHAAIPGKPIF